MRHLYLIILPKTLKKFTPPQPHCETISKTDESSLGNTYNDKACARTKDTDELRKWFDNSNSLDPIS